MGRHKWTDEDIQYLVDNYADMDNEDIAKHIGVTASKVKNTAERLRARGYNLNKSEAFMKSMHERQIRDLHDWWREDTEEKNEMKRLRTRDTIIAKLNAQYSLNPDQVQVMLGSCIGNASMRRQYRGNVDPFPYIVFGHGERYRCYLEWKYRTFEDLAMEAGIDYVEYNESTFGDGGYYRFSTRHLPCFIQYHEILRPNDEERKVTREWIDMIDTDNPLALAVFYMDVGYMAHPHSILKSGEMRYYNRIGFSLGTKTKAEGKLIMGWIEKATGITPRMYVGRNKDRQDELVVRIDTQADVRTFVAFVEPVVRQVPCMAHLVELIES